MASKIQFSNEGMKWNTYFGQKRIDNFGNNYIIILYWHSRAENPNIQRQDKIKLV